MQYETVIGLEVHAELRTRSKMFCSCAVVDATAAAPNSAVCPVCAGMPGMLPVLNEQAVELALRVALALECTIAETSIFARKNYFYPDLPKGYQISQYELPLAQHGRLVIPTAQGEKKVRILRVHLEEDTGKLTHITAAPPGEEEEAAQGYSLVDLNRAGVPLLEIVSEPDLRSAAEARAYAESLRAILRSLGVNSGDMEKGVIRFEANVSLRPSGSQTLGTRVEIKNLNSFRAMERAIVYQVEQQTALLDAGEQVEQETLGWDEARGMTYSQRSKEEAHDYRYFPEPDLPPLIVDPAWIERVRAGLPELPADRARRFSEQYGLSTVDARALAQDSDIAAYFEAAASTAPARALANWITGELFGWLNESGKPFTEVRVAPRDLADLVQRTGSEINLTTAKSVFAEMLATGQSAPEIIAARGLQQINDSSAITELVENVLAANSKELSAYIQGKETLANWFFGQAMRAAKGQANPQVLRETLERALARRKQQ